MKGVVFISVFWALAFAAALLSQAQEPSDKQQARQLAEQVLNGREVIVRLYVDPKNNPRAFDRLSIKLDGLYVTSDAVRLAFAASTTAGQVDVSFERLLASGEAARTSLDRLVQSAQAIQPVFEATQQSVQVIEQATGRKFVPLWQSLDYESRLTPAPSVWSLPGLVADSANTASSALAQVLRSARGDVTLDKMLQAGKTFQAAVPPIDRWTRNLRLGLSHLTNFAQAIKSRLDPNAPSAEQVNSAISQIVRSADEIAPDLDRMVDDARAVYRAGERVETSVRAVERNLDKMLELKALLVTAEDQQDQAVAAVVGEFVHGQYYRVGSLSIWPKELAPPRYQWCLFQDADQQPVAGAAVEVMLGRGYQWNEGVWLWIRNSQLDEKGRLKAPRLGSGVFDKLIFMIHYPEFGAVPVGPHAMELPNEPHLIYAVPVLPKDKWCVFKDALGNPMPNTTVEIFHDVGWRKESGRMETVTLDEKGRLKPPRLDPRLAYCCFIVSHPDYGTALVEPRWAFRPDKPLESCTVPLVHKDSDAWQRSIWGVVQDEQGNPVSQAIIECSGLRTRGGASISHTDMSSLYGRFSRTITDDQGGFNFYFPIVSDDRQRLVPPQAQYSLRVAGPKELGLVDYEGFAIAGEETIITMQRQRAQAELPILVFQDEFGPVTDPNRLKKVGITIQYGAGWTSMGYEDWLRESRFRPGTYSATADWDGKRYEFEPVQLTEDSPKIVVFKIKRIEAQDTVYRGQVVHGITSQPMRGAFVIIARFREGDFAGITPQQWQQLHGLPDNPDPCDPALEPVGAVRPFDRILRTDGDGRFQINIKPTARLDSLIAFEQDFLGVPYGLSISKEVYNPNDLKLVDLPTIRLYPAAVVIIEPQIEQDVREVITRWNPGNNEDVDWLEGFLEFYRKMTTSFVINDRLRPNVPQRLQVLAGVNIGLTLQPIQHGRMDCPWWCPVQTETFRAAQGQVIDLGKVTFQRQIPVYIKVVDSRGQLLEDVLVANGQADGSRWTGQQQATDQNGLAQFYVPPYHQGAFLVGWQGPKTQTPWQKLIYQTTGPQDANSVFTFQLSEQVLKHMLK